jgi:glycosyltransferase involved in cell wall biosynthesis
MLDAAACGLPVVVNDTLRATERIEGNGMTYALNDPVSLERVLVQLLDPGRRRSLGDVGARRMVEQFSWDSLVQRRIKDYERALSASRETRQ